MVRLDLQLFGTKKVTDAIVNDVIRGKYGNGDARKTALANAGYNYSEVQAAVNAKLKGDSSTKPASTQNTKPANTQTNTPATTFNITGVSQTTQDKINNNLEFKPQDSTNELKQNSDDRNNKFYELADKENIVDQKYLDAMDKEWVVPEVVTQVDAWLTSQREQLQSGKTQWTDKYNAAIDKYLNREEFVYDVDNDPLFQQALASAMNSGKTAMQDTIGQASALTGGYGSTYATSAGNQAYNSFIEDAYNNLPQYYQMALSAYEAEGQDLYNQVAMLGNADATEYGKMMDAYNITADHRNQLYNEAYTTFRDSKTDAYNAANLQLGIYGTQLDAAYKGADLANTQWQQAYTNDFNTWNANVSNLFAIAGMEQSDYQFGVQQDQWNQEFGLQQKQYKLSTGDTNGDGILSDAEKAEMNTTYSYDSNGQVVKGTASDKNTVYTTDAKGNRVAVDVDSIPKDVSTKASKFKDNDDGLTDYLEEQVKLGNISEPQSYYLYDYYSTESSSKDSTETITPSKVGTVNWEDSANQFTVDEGENFDVKVGDETYRVENHGKVDDKDTLKELKKYDVKNGQVFIYNGDPYVYYGGAYYKAGATNILFWETSGKVDLINALQ